ncbi:hypothetical protein M407DRAFT_123928 [Tulasnella calospora MUT 4182]|uniref:Deacetylase sirtuin-type domain-containing protein n=1 Tax=Tulasnella calospora MUT 4182 TaxID=1051891 RepID=A0A0C3QA80_9AGAM|nr:hypothetical protein M407DRAFT_123928 [Tulasnella calospora MUT 4182]
MAPSSDMETFGKVLASSKSLAILAGAGLSAASGIPTYRGAGGLWRTHDAMSLATPEAFEDNPSLVWKFYHERREKAITALPNAAHKALASLYLPMTLSRVAPSLDPSECPNPLFITQNVDSLSLRVLSESSLNLPEAIQAIARESLLEMHGSLFRLRCTECERDYRDYSSPLSEILAEATERHSESGEDVEVPVDKLPRCGDGHPDSCGGLLRPGVVWFGEVPEHLDQISNKLDHCDLLLIVGTSSTVYPAAGFADIVKGKGGKTAVFNLERSSGDRRADFLFIGPCEETLPQALGIAV